MSPTHGLASTYRGKYGCRCDECREAHRLRHVAENARRAARPRDEVPHGTEGGYINWGCRCEPCAEANKAACAARRKAAKGPQPRLYLVVMIALVAMAAGIAGTDAAIIAHRGGLARPAVERPAPRANPSPVLTSTHGGAR